MLIINRNEVSKKVKVGEGGHFFKAKYWSAFGDTYI